MPRASILIPTHDHWATLPLAAGSALEQTVDDIEVILIGDGVCDEVRATATDLCRADPRVIFLDLPKGPNHGEIHRDRAITLARSDAIFYLCDDDLLLPRHVENLLGLLSVADLVQSRNGYIDPQGRLILYPTDLSDPEAVAWHLKTPRRNATSLTGTAHRRCAYLELPEGWTTTPVDEWPDHYMWKKFFRIDGFRGATHSELTALQLPTSSGRDQANQDERVAELIRWRDQLTEPGAHEHIQQMADSAAAAQLAVCYRQLVDRAQELEALNAELRSGASELRSHVVAMTALEHRAHALDRRLTVREATLSEVLASRSWRLTAPLRRLVGRRRTAPPTADWNRSGSS